MNYKQHTLIGLLSISIFAILMHLIFNWFSIDLKTIISVLIIGYVYCLLPDLDHRMSKITWLFLGISISGVLIGVLNTYYKFIPAEYHILIPSLILLVLTFLCARFAKHRGIIHTLRIGLIFSALVYFIIPDWKFCIIALLSYQSHLMSDGYFFRF